MSTTLVPPSFYVVTPEGESAREYRTVSETAAAMVQLGRTPVSVDVVTGCRRRSLTEGELRELGSRIRAVRICAARSEWRQRALTWESSSEREASDPKREEALMGTKTPREVLESAAHGYPWRPAPERSWEDSSTLASGASRGDISTLEPGS